MSTKKYLKGTTKLLIRKMDKRKLNESLAAMSKIFLDILFAINKDGEYQTEKKII